MPAFGGVHAANDGGMLHLLGKFREVFADLNAGNRGRNGPELAGILGAGLHVECVLLAWAAFHPEQDTRLVLDAGSGRVRRHQVEPAGHRRQGRPGRRQPQKIAPRQFRHSRAGHQRTPRSEVRGQRSEGASGQTFLSAEPRQTFLSAPPKQ